MSWITLSRDDFFKIVAAPDFIEHNPAFAPVQENLAQCKAAYDESAKKKSCSCGGSPQLIFGCLDATVELLERFREENPAAVAALLAYVQQKRNDPRINGFTLYYRKTAQEPLRKVKIP
jgi:hypothetical protein